MRRLLEMTDALSRATSLEQTLQVVVDAAAELLSTPRVSLRLFDPTHTLLIATARAGQPLHRNATYDYKKGQGLIGWVAEHAQPICANDAEADPRFEHRPDMVDRMGSFLGAPVIHDGKVIGVLSAAHGDKNVFSKEHEELVSLIAGICAPHVEVARLERLAQVDVLTGAFNRRGIELFFPESTRRKLSVAMIDIDHFKRINDELGHHAGDDCLKKLARLLSESVRADDAVIRFGGEEFLLVMPAIDVPEAQHIAERIRAAVESAVLLEDRRVTISMGVTQHLAGEKRQETLMRADQALYAAKEQGRNRVIALP